MEGKNIPEKRDYFSPNSQICQGVANSKDIASWGSAAGVFSAGIGRGRAGMVATFLEVEGHIKTHSPNLFPKS